MPDPSASGAARRSKRCRATRGRRYAGWRHTRRSRSRVCLKPSGAWYTYAVNRRMRPGSAGCLSMVVLIATCVATSSASAFRFQTFRVTCRDGERDVVISSGERRKKAHGFCDVDRTCDGICTFALTAICARCWVKPCGDPASILCADREPPCPSRKSYFALPVVPGRTTRSVQVLEYPIGVPATFKLRCRAARQCLTTTTTTLPHDVPDLTGDWRIAEASVSDSCPPGVAERFAGRDLRLLQTGSELLACGEAIIVARAAGEVSPMGFGVDTGPCCSILIQNGFYDFSQRLSGDLPAMDGRVAVMEQVDLIPDGEPQGRSPCSITVAGKMLSTMPACATHADCISVNACYRCASGRCVRNRFCWG